MKKKLLSLMFSTAILTTSPLLAMDDALDRASLHTTPKEIIVKISDHLGPQDLWPFMRTSNVIFEAITGSRKKINLEIIYNNNLWDDENRYNSILFSLFLKDTQNTFHFGTFTMDAASRKLDKPITLSSKKLEKSIFLPSCTQNVVDVWFENKNANQIAFNEKDSTYYKISDQSLKLSDLSIDSKLTLSIYAGKDLEYGGNILGSIGPVRVEQKNTSVMELVKRGWIKIG